MSISGRNTMSKIRKINIVKESRPTLEGAGVHLRRAFGFGETSLFDPFLLFDDFRGDDPAGYMPGFPWHPHRGIETITYMLKGAVEHGDSMGNRGVIGQGDVQWMTAGSGIIHQEMPRGDAQGRMYGFQLWANLPKANKMMDPRYQEIKSEQIPEVPMPGGVRIRVICGQAGGIRGPVEGVVTGPEYLDVCVPAGGEYNHPTVSGHTVIAYVIAGAGSFCPEEGSVEAAQYDGGDHLYATPQRSHLLGNRTLIVFSDGDEIQVSAGEHSVRFLMMSGKPIKEPVAWNGPIVMNTNEELRQAYEDLQNGTFIKEPDES
ncbi:MAG: pirin family protein [Anaerolineaceae bacterium]